MPVSWVICPSLLTTEYTRWESYRTQSLGTCSLTITGSLTLHTPWPLSPLFLWLVSSVTLSHPDPPRHTQQKKRVRRTSRTSSPSIPLPPSSLRLPPQITDLGLLILIAFVLYSFSFKGLLRPGSACLCAEWRGEPGWDSRLWNSIQG